MFKDNILDLIRSMFVNDLMHSVGYSFTHEHKFTDNNYQVSVEVHTIIDPTCGKFSPMLSVVQSSDDFKRSNVLRITNRTCFSINGSSGFARQFNVLDNDIETQWKEHGFLPDEIEIIKSLFFSINMYIDKQE